jgi:hypothetical protein
MMKKILLVVGHQRSAQGAVNHEVKQSEWEFNGTLINLIVGLMGEKAVMLCQDVPHWKKAPIINDLHAKTPFAAVIEFHLNSCDKAPKVNYTLAKYARGSAQGHYRTFGELRHPQHEHRELHQSRSLDRG